MVVVEEIFDFLLCGKENDVYAKVVQAVQVFEERKVEEQQPDDADPMASLAWSPLAAESAAAEEGR